MKPVAALVALTVAAQATWAQSSPAEDEVAAFVAGARQSTVRYQDQREALKDGYRRIGPDFPSMGEHWLNRAIVIRGEVNPLYPPILEYITVGGQPVLAGVAYAKLAYDEAPHTAIPAPATAWHYHAGSVDEESFIASHAAGGASAHSASGPRIAVLHAWLWAENPAGLFATDNWALPWLRLGMEPPEESHSPVASVLAAALAAGGEHYFATLLRVRFRLTGEQTSQVAAILALYAGQLRAQVGVAATEEIARTWSRLEDELRLVCADCALRTVH